LSATPRWTPLCSVAFGRRRPDPRPHPPEASSRGPFVAIRVGGPLQTVVTLTAIAEGHGRSVVEASWIDDGHGHPDSVEVDSYGQARLLADAIAEQLAAGTPPDLSRG
jgi:hypothetical protein